MILHRYHRPQHVMFVTVTAQIKKQFHQYIITKRNSLFEFVYLCSSILQLDGDKTLNSACIIIFCDIINQPRSLEAQEKNNPVTRREIYCMMIL
jgi:hypothetical protein